MYNKILSSRLVSSSTDSFVCHIAVLKQKIKQICVFDIKNENETMRVLNFFDNPTS